MNANKNPLIDVITNVLLGELKDPRNTTLGVPSIFDVIKMGDVKNPIESFKSKSYPDKTTYEMDVPGVKTEDIEVNTENSILTVTATRYTTETIFNEELKNDEEKTVKSGVYEHEILLKDNADVKKITANYENGVLTITVPIKDEAKSRSIKVEGK